MYVGQVNKGKKQRFLFHEENIRSQFSEIQFYFHNIHDVDVRQCLSGINYDTCIIKRLVAASGRTNICYTY